MEGILMLATVMAIVFGVVVLTRWAAGLPPVPGWVSRRLSRIARSRAKPTLLLLAGLALVSLVFLSVEPGLFAVLLGLFALFALFLFAREWLREWFFLMDLGDEDLPGRFDKPIWAFVMTAFFPVGLWLFRGYRLRRWPETAAAAKPEPVPELF